MLLHKYHSATLLADRSPLHIAEKEDDAVNMEESMQVIDEADHLDETEHPF